MAASDDGFDNQVFDVGLRKSVMLLAETVNDSVTQASVFGPWSCCSHAPGTVAHPNELNYCAPQWLPATVPGTVAQMLRAADRWDMQHPPEIDALDWWYRTSFSGHDGSFQTSPVWLTLDGLATLAEIWLNGELLLKTDNMFRSYRLDLSSHIRSENDLAIAFRSLTGDLQKKRPRPRWKTNLVNHQQLRWQRTTLVGRIPGWSPPVPAIGPWRDIRLERSPVCLRDQRLQTRLEGADGIVTFAGRLESMTAVERVWLRVGDTQQRLTLSTVINDGAQTGDATVHELTGTLRLSDVALWWPHTHGNQPLFASEIIVETNSQQHRFDSGKLGFRQLEVNRNDGFAVTINGQPVYCRGACWTISDVFTLDGTEESLRRDLTLAREAGVNMLRVIGTMIYESDTFYRLCDELGIMVWQDLMFANMDYPVADSTFRANIEAEAIEQIGRLSSHPSVVVYCGNSEVEQQAAMLGMPRDIWSNEWFSTRLPELCTRHHPGTEYVTSTPTGGVLPFHPNQGITHFYGVGAYLRSPAELRQTDVKFTPECLGFANVPEPETVHEITEGASPALHHPKWKQRVPRDTGAGWDFEDVRDHYLKLTYGVDPVGLRSIDTRRYLELSRLVSGEMMAGTFSEWRSCHSQNGGGLVWFFKDLWPAAGWGVVDSHGQPKPAYYFLKRTWQSRQLTLTDEGLNGMHVHLINEANVPLSGELEVTLLKEPNVVVARAKRTLELAGRCTKQFSADEILGGFYDTSYAYRFGPAHHDVVIATLLDANGSPISEAFHFIRRRESNIVPVGIEATARPISNGDYQVNLKADRFLHAVRITADGYLPEDNYFHLPPGRLKQVQFRPVNGTAKPFRAEVEALNLESPVDVASDKA